MPVNIANSGGMLSTSAQPPQPQNMALRHRLWQQTTVYRFGGYQTRSDDATTCGYCGEGNLYIVERAAMNITPQCAICSPEGQAWFCVANVISIKAPEFSPCQPDRKKKAIKAWRHAAKRVPRQAPGIASQRRCWKSKLTLDKITSLSRAFCAPPQSNNQKINSAFPASPGKNHLGWKSNALFRKVSCAAIEGDQQTGMICRVRIALPHTTGRIPVRFTR